MLATKLDPNEQVLCSECGWHGRIRECNPKPKDLVKCPKCGKAVSRIVADDSFIVEK